MALYLRKIIHPQAHDNYRVILKLDEGDSETGSIGLQHSAGAAYCWAWGIDTVIPMRALETQGKCKDRKDCMKQFKAAWERFAADEAVDLDLARTVAFLGIVESDRRGKARVS